MQIDEIKDQICDVCRKMPDSWDGLQQTMEM